MSGWAYLFSIISSSYNGKLVTRHAYCRELTYTYAQYAIVALSLYPASLHNFKIRKAANGGLPPTKGQTMKRSSRDDGSIGTRRRNR